MTDIPILADFFLEKYATRHKRPARHLHPEAVETLKRYHWPGNVRELENALERAVIVTSEAQVRVADLPQAVRQPKTVADVADTIPPDCTLKEIERLAILRTLERTQWNKRATANILGIYRPTLYSKLKKYNLERPPQSRGVSADGGISAWRTPESVAPSERAS